MRFEFDWLIRGFNDSDSDVGFVDANVSQDSGYGITHMIGVPANYLFMSQHPDFAAADLSRLRAMAVGGAPTSLELLKIYADKGNALQQAFGMTETSPLVTALTPTNALDKPGSAGLPVLHTEIRLVDEFNIEQAFFRLLLK